GDAGVGGIGGGDRLGHAVEEGDSADEGVRGRVAVEGIVRGQGGAAVTRGEVDGARVAGGDGVAVGVLRRDGHVLGDAGGGRARRGHAEPDGDTGAVHFDAGLL